MLAAVAGQAGEEADEDFNQTVAEQHVPRWLYQQLHHHPQWQHHPRHV